jgi:hypothetical protein
MAAPALRQEGTSRPRGEEHGDLVPALDLEKHGAAGVTPPITCISLMNRSAEMLGK